MLVTVWGCECVSVCACAGRRICVYSVALLCVKCCLGFALTFALTLIWSSCETVFKYPESCRKKNGQFWRGCSAETHHPMHSYLRHWYHHKCFDPTPWGRETIQINLWSHLIQCCESASWECERERAATREIERVGVVALSVYQRALQSLWQHFLACHGSILIYRSPCRGIQRSLQGLGDVCNAKQSSLLLWEKIQWYGALPAWTYLKMASQQIQTHLVNLLICKSKIYIVESVCISITTQGKEQKKKKMFGGLAFKR